MLEIECCLFDAPLALAVEITLSAPSLGGALESRELGRWVKAGAGVSEWLVDRHFGALTSCKGGPSNEPRLICASSRRIVKSADVNRTLDRYTC